MSAIIHITGNLTRDPETREAGKSTVTKLSVANNYKERGEDHTVFYSVDFWGAYGEALVKHFSKGDRISVCGEHQVREYQASSGETRFSQDVRGLKWDFAGSHSGGSGSAPREYDDGGVEF